MTQETTCPFPTECDCEGDTDDEGNPICIYRIICDDCKKVLRQHQNDMDGVESYPVDMDNPNCFDDLCYDCKHEQIFHRPINNDVVIHKLECKHEEEKKMWRAEVEELHKMLHSFEALKCVKIPTSIPTSNGKTITRIKIKL
tara:strand:- start:47 stop:472 length:426 start_codon:yes stop_codon:yes gene_type:complete